MVATNVTPSTQHKHSLAQQPTIVALNPKALPALRRTTSGKQNVIVVQKSSGGLPQSARTVTLPQGVQVWASKTCYYSPAPPNCMLIKKGVDVSKRGPVFGLKHFPRYFILNFGL